MLYGEYCSHCGQRSAEAITFPFLWLRFWERVRALDFAWLRTTLDLVTDPGRMARHYVAGRRLPYTSPFAYAGAMATLLVGLAVVLDLDLSARFTPWGPSPIRPASLATFGVAVFAGPGVAILVAWLQRSLFSNERYTLAETWVFGLFVFGHFSLHQLVFGTLGAFASELGLAALGGVLLMVLSFALASFYRRPVLRVLPAALILGTVYVAGVSIVSASVRLVGGF